VWAAHWRKVCPLSFPLIRRLAPIQLRMEQITNLYDRDKKVHVGGSITVTSHRILWVGPVRTCRVLCRFYARCGARAGTHMLAGCMYGVLAYGKRWVHRDTRRVHASSGRVSAVRRGVQVGIGKLHIGADACIQVAQRYKVAQG
jgi:hypothetical protein